MNEIRHRRAANLQHPQGSELDRVSWDDLRYFLVAAREMSFRKAAIVLRTDSGTVSRHIKTLERQLDMRLFDRLPDGVQLTAEGTVVLEDAKRMEEATIRLRRHTDRDVTARGVVRCNITEGLGTFWLMPRLAEFHRANPFTRVQLRCNMNIADVVRLETDVAVQLVKPEAPGMKSEKIGRLHVSLFASPRYLDSYGAPATLQEITRHRLIEQISPQLPNGILARLLGFNSIETSVFLQTDVSSTHFHAIETGIGIGLLPSYAIPLGANVIALDLPVYRGVDIWMTYHPDVRLVPRVRLFIQWVRSIFDPARYPWFADEHIHPNELRGWRPSRIGPVVPLAEGVVAHPSTEEF